MAGDQRMVGSCRTQRKPHSSGALIMKRLASSFALVLMLGSWQALAQSAGEGIEAASKEFEAAFNGGDGAGVASLYTDDAALLPPGAPRVDGKEAIATFWQGAIDAGLSDLDLATVEVMEADDLAIEVGTLMLNAPGADGAAGPVTGKFVVVWHRGDDDTWRLHRDIWNIDPPLE
jgi:uncharacterized protein (TIGR02246 family)